MMVAGKFTWNSESHHHVVDGYNLQRNEQHRQTVVKSAIAIIGVVYVGTQDQGAKSG